MLIQVFFSTFIFVQQPSDGELLHNIQGAVRKGANALILKQNTDGGYGPQFGGKSDVGVTALVIWALAESPDKYREWQSPCISAALDFLLKHQQPNGGIYDNSLWNYKTCISIMALSSLGSTKYEKVIKKAVEFVKGQQLNEKSRIPYKKERNVDWGGWGYGSSMRADLSNTQFAVETLHKTDMNPDDPILDRVKVYLTRCQNSCDTNDAIVDGMIPKWGTNDDGGFIYRPGEGKVPPVKLQDGSLSYSSYGSMTYAGIKSFIYAHVDKNDKRVQKAYKWICKHYTLDENPGMAVKDKPGSGKQGLFYYYRTMAKALLALEKPYLPTAEGKKRWAEDLAVKLLSLQESDGTWCNKVDRWWEGIPEVTTAYAILTLQDCSKALKKWPVQGK